VECSENWEHPYAATISLNVDYRGQMAPEQTLKVIGEASLFLSTSDREEFPSVFLEAWVAGTLVDSLQINPDHKIRNGGPRVVIDTLEGAVDVVCFLMTSPECRQDIRNEGPAPCRGNT
jgi:hypothetical protein